MSASSVACVGQLGKTTQNLSGRVLFSQEFELAPGFFLSRDSEIHVDLTPSKTMVRAVANIPEGWMTDVKHDDDRQKHRSSSDDDDMMTNKPMTMCNSSNRDFEPGGTCEVEPMMRSSRRI